MTDTERLTRLAKRAEELKELSVAEQFRILAKEGFTLAETNWENWRTDPGETIIPARRPPGSTYES